MNGLTKGIVAQLGPPELTFLGSKFLPLRLEQCRSLRDL
jgi:hypothetical protein